MRVKIEDERSLVLGMVVVGLVVFSCASRQVASTNEIPVGHDSPIDVSVYLIGDAGRARPGDPVLSALERMAAGTPDRSAIVFLGDNLYPDGLDSVGSAERQSDEERLRVLANVGRPAGVRTFMMAGNHDWNDFDRGGWRAVVDQQEFIDGLGIPTLSYLPKQGCPGPSVLDLGAMLRIVILDTAWWLYDGEKPGPGNSDCSQRTETEVVAALDSVLGGGGNRRLLVAAHHPLESGGPHGGHFDWKDHIFPLRHLASWAWLPLPVVGSIYPLVRGLGVNRQDLGSEEYTAMTDSLERVFRRHDVIAYVAGHDHSLQVIRHEATRYSLVSGAGPSTGLTSAARTPDSEFAMSAWGFMRIDVHEDGGVRLRVFAVDSRTSLTEVFSRWLTSSSHR